MSDPIRAIGIPIALEGPASNSSAGEQTTSFREVLDDASTEETSPLRDALVDAARSLADGDMRVQRGLRAARRGGMDPAELLALQAGVYRYAQEVDLASKIVDKATGALKTALQSQQ